MFGFGRFLRGNPIALFFRKLSLMVGSGVPLPEALDAISQGMAPGHGMRHPFAGRAREALAQVAADVRKGGTLSAALEAAPQLFSPELVAILKSGEASGNLLEALTRIADALEDGTLRTARRGPGMPWFFRGHGHAHGHGEPPERPGHEERGHHDHENHEHRHGHHEHRGWGPPWRRGHHEHREEVRHEVRGPRHPHDHRPPPPRHDGPPPRHDGPPPRHAGPPPPPRTDGPPPPARDAHDALPRSSTTAAELFAAAVRARASDVHIEPLPRGGRVRFRVDGRLSEHRRIATPEEYQALVDAIKDWAYLDVAERRLPQDARAALTVDDQRVQLRLATSPYVHGEGVTARLVTSTGVPRLDALALSERDHARVTRWLGRSHGLIVVTGPTGTGKTTTCYAMLETFDAATRKLVTVEQPVEHVVEGANQLSLAPELGLTWQTALRTQLKHDPDVVLIGEVPSPEVAELSVRTALTGHVVLTIFHADSAAALFCRLAAAGLAPALVQEALTGVLAQRLVRRLCPDCRERIDQPQLPPETQNAYAHLLGGSYRAVFADEHGQKHEVKVALPPGTYYRAKGCDACAQSGYRGRVALFELAEPAPSLIPLLARGASTQELSVALVEAGMRSLLADGIEKAGQGLTTLDEVLRECLF